MKIKVIGKAQIIIQSGTWKHVYLTSYKGGGPVADNTDMVGGVLYGDAGIWEAWGTKRMALYRRGSCDIME